jgi:gliding motility-associated-like protein
MNDNTVFVTNSTISAVQRTNGFVSSLENGGLLRYTRSDSAYLFPVGSSLGVSRYRPIEMQPSSSNLNRFKVRFANTDPSTEGFDRNRKFHLVCEVNPAWYHRIWRISGTDSASIKIFYDSAADGTWNDMVHWQIMPEWRSMPKSLQMTGTPLSYMQRINWSNFSYPAYALATTSLPFADAGSDTSVIHGNLIQLNGSGGILYKWRDATTLTDSTVPNPYAFPLVTTTYYLTVTNDLGCEDYDSVQVRVLPRPQEQIPKEIDTVFFIPNTITPNNDGYNDVWYIRGLERFPENNVRIFNRWGDEVFYEEPYSNVWQGYWNGNPLPGATYYYVLKVKIKGEWKIFNGPLTIVR